MNEPYHAALRELAGDEKANTTAPRKCAWATSSSSLTSSACSGPSCTPSSAARSSAATSSPSTSRRRRSGSRPTLQIEATDRIFPIAFHVLPAHFPPMTSGSANSHRDHWQASAKQRGAQGELRLVAGNVVRAPADRRRSSARRHCWW